MILSSIAIEREGVTRRVTTLTGSRDAPAQKRGEEKGHECEHNRCSERKGSQLFERTGSGGSQ